MAFLFETRTLGSIASSVASEVTTTISTALDRTSPTLAALIPSASSTIASALETTTTTIASTSVTSIVETTTSTEDPGFFDGFSTMTNEDSTFARFVEILQENPESSGLQDVTDNLTNVAVSIVKQSKMEANIETLNLNLNQLFLLINGSLVILMQVNLQLMIITLKFFP